MSIRLLICLSGSFMANCNKINLNARMILSFRSKAEDSFVCVFMSQFMHNGVNVHVYLSLYLYDHVNPGSDIPEISLVRTKSVGTDFLVRTNGRFSNL